MAWFKVTYSYCGTVKEGYISAYLPYDIANKLYSLPYPPSQASDVYRIEICAEPSDGTQFPVKVY